MNFAIIGGDMRQLYVCAALEKRGCTVTLFGFEQCENAKSRYRFAAAPEEAAAGADCVLLPFPAENERKNINAPFCCTEIYMPDVFSAVKTGTPVLGGKLSEGMMECAARHKIRLFDYAAREELIIKNAIPSAEGAIQIAMEELPVTLNGSNCLVTGYGRIGKVLSAMLSALGAKVTVSARKAADMEWIRFHGCQAVETGALSGQIGGFDAVFNTVPSLIFTQELIEQLPEACLIIDLASMPGGVDFSAARRAPRKAIHALSLPGKVAPATAGEAVAETVLNLLKETGLEP